MRVLFEDNNHDVWIGTIAGLQRLHQGFFTSYTDQDGLPRGRSQSDAVFEDASGAIWVGTLEGGVAELKNGEWRRFGPAEGISLGQVLGFAEGQRAPVVAISDYGLFAWSRNRFSKMAPVPVGRWQWNRRGDSDLRNGPPHRQERAVGAISRRQ